MNKHTQHGFSLIELIVFISVLGVISVGTFAVIDNVLRLNGQPTQVLQAAALARSRMEIVLLNRQNGYSTLSDPCEASSPPDACSALSTYASNSQFSVTSNISESAPTKTISISVNGTDNNPYSLRARVSNYD